MLELEVKLIKKNLNTIAGVDEAGRGPLAGPLVVAAVMFEAKQIIQLHTKTPKTISAEDFELFNMINDSKKLSKKKRELLFDFIVKQAKTYSIQTISNKVIDSKGISHATQIGFYNSQNELHIKPKHVLTDNFNILGLNQNLQTNIVKGDSKSISIAAASILAKVHRDKIMQKAHDKFPVYGFESHKGYGTKKHIQAITEHGICDLHRKTFEPIKSLIKIQK